MTEFVDTNILLYAYDAGAILKQNISIELLERLSRDGVGALSVQVLVEFYSNATRKFRMSSSSVEEAIEDFSAWRVHRPDYSSVIDAIHLQRGNKLSWLDAMILNSALESGCSVLWTEDFNDGQRFGDLVIRNPYKNSHIF